VDDDVEGPTAKKRKIGDAEANDEGDEAGVQSDEGDEAGMQHTGGASEAEQQ
jgi:hypothetical protein